eukprot:5219394-Amphidinium_carterae.1
MDSTRGDLLVMFRGVDYERTLRKGGNPHLDLCPLLVLRNHDHAPDRGYMTWSRMDLTKGICHGNSLLR